MARLSHENIDQYQVEFDAMVRDFCDVVDEIERRAFEKMDEALGDAKGKIIEEDEKLAER